jgi:HEAT repeat protein
MALFRTIASCLLVCACLPLVRGQQDTNPRQRVRAARDLAKQGADAIPKLAPMLKDPSTDVRVEAVKAIVQIDTQYSLGPLIEATRDNDAEVQIRATDGLVNFYLPGYVQSGVSATLKRAGSAIRASFTGTPPQVIDPYVEVRPEIIAALGKLVTGGISMESRANAARALGILRGKAAVPELTKALQSDDDQVILESLLALQKIRDPESAPALSFLVLDMNPQIQLAAIETAGLLGNREALPRLRRAFDNTEDKNVRRAALAAIAMLRDPGSRQLFLQYMNDKDEELRAAAAEGLARLKNEADLPAIQKVYASEGKMPPRLAQAFALVSLGQTQVTEFSPLQYLLNTLNSVAWRGVSRAYLIELTRDPAVRANVQQMLRNGTKGEKIELSDILARSGDKDTLPYLEALSHDPDTDVANAALNGLRTLKSRFP